MTITSAQLRAARGLLDWSVRDLSGRTGVHRNTIWAFEGDKTEPNPSTLKVLAMALEEAGVIFVPENGDGAGVRLRKV